MTSKRLLYAVAMGLPVILLYTSVRTFQELDDQREVYLRERMASIAGRLEATSLQMDLTESALTRFVENEPDLRGLQVFSSPDENAPEPLKSIWNGTSLFHMQFDRSGPVRVYRAYIPFHADGTFHVAQMDLDAGSSDFLVVHARHNVMVSLMGGIALVLISIYAMWAVRRSATLEKEQLRLSHLAELGTMSAVLAHEIRNPLGTIKGFAQLALEKADSSVRPLLAPVLTQSKRLEDLVNDLLIFGRPPVPSIRQFEWSETAADLRVYAGTLTAGKPVHVDIEDAQVPINSDPALLQQILTNLIRNAVDAVDGQTEGKVQVLIRPSPEWLQLLVRDNGPGVPDGDFQRIRAPFHTTKAFGTGLGLSITARLTEALGGIFDIYAAGDRGVEASVRLPSRRSQWNKS